MGCSGGTEKGQGMGDRGQGTRDKLEPVTAQT